MKNLNLRNLVTCGLMTALCACAELPGPAEEAAQDESGTGDVYELYHEEAGITDVEVEETGFETEESGETGETDEARERRLSEEARDRLKAVATAKKTIAESARAICSRDQDLHDIIRGELDAILADDSLDREGRRAAARTVLDGHRDALQADREAVQICRSENEEELSALRASMEELNRTCLVPPPHRRGPGGGHVRIDGGERQVKIGPGAKKGSPAKKRPRLPDQAVERLETKLLSDDCAAVITR